MICSCAPVDPLLWSSHTLEGQEKDGGMSFAAAHGEPLATQLNVPLGAPYIMFMAYGADAVRVAHTYAQTLGRCDRFH